MSPIAPPALPAQHRLHGSAWCVADSPPPAWPRPGRATLLLSILACTLWVANPAQAATTDGTPTAAVTETAAAPAAFEVEIDAPAELTEFLQRHLELFRYRQVPDLDARERQALLAAAEAQSRELLATRGHFAALVTSGQKPAAGAGTPPVRLWLRVEPGPPAIIERVHIAWVGPFGEDPAEAGRRAVLREGWTLPPGTRFTQSDWDTAKQALLTALSARRYARARLVRSLAEVDDKFHHVSLHLDIDPGPPVAYGALRITGNHRVETEQIIRFARLRPGAEYDRADVQAAQQRLIDSGHFDSVFVSVANDDDPQAAAVSIELREARRQKLVFGLGASTDSGTRLSAVHTHHQVPPVGWRAVTKISWDREQHQFGSEWLSPPDEGGWRWAVAGDLRREAAASYRIDARHLRLGRTLSSRDTDRNYFVQIERARTHGAPSAVLLSQSANAVSLNLALTRRRFDRLPFPAEGSGLALELGGGVTLDGQRTPFARGMARWTHYWPLARHDRSGRPEAGAGRLVSRVQVGGVLARSDAALPATQLFLTGGDSSVRGYGLNEIGVRQADASVAAGRFLAVGSLELQRPISIGGRPGPWEWVVFADGGAVANRVSALRAQVGLGAGIRWRSPVGPLQMDLAWGRESRALRLHLNVGFTF